MLYNIAICDDEPSCIDLIVKYLSLYKDTIQISKYKSGEQLFKAIKKETFHIIFLDMHMNVLSGLDTAKLIRQRDDDAIIIFTTAIRDYALEAYSVNPLAYLVKPITEDKFVETFEKALKQCAQIKAYEVVKPQKEKGHLIIEVDSKPIKLMYDEIVQFVTNERKMLVTTKNRCYVFVSTINELEKQLDPLYFVKYAKHGIINLGYIKTIDNFEITLYNDEILFVSRRRLKEVNDAHTNYLWEKADGNGMASN